jgi:hypothetical protein
MEGTSTLPNDSTGTIASCVSVVNAPTNPSRSWSGTGTKSSVQEANPVISVPLRDTSTGTTGAGCSIATRMRVAGDPAFDGSVGLHASATRPMRNRRSPGRIPSRCATDPGVTTVTRIPCSSRADSTDSCTPSTRAVTDGVPCASTTAARPTIPAKPNATAAARKRASDRAPGRLHRCHMLHLVRGEKPPARHAA